MHKLRSWMLAALAVVVLPVAASATEVPAVERLERVDNSDVYSKLYLSASAYVIKDKDFNPAQPKQGFFTTWLFDPSQKDLFQLQARYCVPNSDIEAGGPTLKQVDLLDNNQVLVSVEQEVAATPAARQTIEPGYYSGGGYGGFGGGYGGGLYDGVYPRGYGLGRGYYGRGYGYGGGYLRQSIPVYRPPVTCATGTTGFDLTPIADRLASLPDRTLKVRLHFSNGEVSSWQLGANTVREIKRLVNIRKNWVS